MRVQPRVKRLLLFSGPRGHVRADLVDNDNTTEQNEERGYISPISSSQRSTRRCLFFSMRLCGTRGRIHATIWSEICSAE